jgi:transposase InsO family protein
LNGLWVELDIRDSVIGFTEMITSKTDISVKYLLSLIGIRANKYYSWNNRKGQANKHNGHLPKENWLLDWEKQAIIEYAKSNTGEGYRRLTYLMLDEDIVAVSPSSTYRVLKDAGLLNRWNNVKKSSKGNGFDQPAAPHQHWHVDIKYVNFRGSFLFLISVIDGFSRYIVHHELRQNMQEFDVQLTIQRAIENYPGYKPRIISDNGSQFISKDFAAYLKFAGLQHIRTSIAYPQSNGKIERYHRTVNQECLRKISLVDLEDARRQVAGYIEFYNSKRLHSSLYFLTPEDFLFNRVEEKLKVREDKITKARLNRIEVRNAS